MVLSSIRLSLGSLVMCILFACADGANKGNKTSQVARTVNDTCNLDLNGGRRLVANLSCTNCHIIWDHGPRMRKDIPLFTELSTMDSLKLRDYIFKTKHNGMYKKDYPDAGKKIDSLSECDKNNLIHYIKDHNKEHTKSASKNK
ncbi:hypothetical protein [Pedobacter cryoconitis]|uniref:Cytochrome c domain-containing protein n=1 Tax=Pedobacter cryoconitis TaxID=188932 RepID=A0A7X0MIW0_9SPHI|nr:hypothetical protein [Pedobacter cryoconitis]MBB6498950.1 hypothetical protein [Pedobacter cryoconitis]